MAAPRNDVTIPKLGNSRVFVQEGPIPVNSADYEGCMALDTSEVPLGDITAIYCPSPDTYNAWDIVGETESAPDLPTVAGSTYMNKYGRDRWYGLSRARCAFNMLVKYGTCGAPDSLDDWDMLTLYKSSKLTSLTLPAANPREGGDNAAAILEFGVTYRAFAEIRRLVFGETADSVVLAEVLDGFYRDFVNCGECGDPSDGCRKQYLLTAANSGSPGLSSQLVVTTNRRSTWFTIDLPLGGLSANAIASVGDNLIVVSQANNAHYYERFDDINANVASFTQVTGYIVGKGPRAVYSKNPSQTFIAAAGGYIYLLSSVASTPTVLTDGSLTVQDFNDIRGAGDVILAGGNSNALVYSENAGDTFALVTAPTAQAGKTITSVEVAGNVWWIGYGDGTAWYSTDKGVTWTRASIPSASIINRIRFVDQAVGYITYQEGGTARVASTVTAGNSWYRGAPRLSNLPTAERYNFIATCGYNEITVGGRVSAGGDGVVAVAN